MGELGTFLQALASQWVGLMSGIVSLSIALWLRIKKRSDIATPFFVFIAILCFFVAFFFIWQDEHHKVQNLEKENTNLRHQLNRKGTGFLQLSKIDVALPLSIIAPGKHFGVNIYSKNAGPERIMNAYGHNWALVEHADEQTDYRVREHVEQEMIPLREAYLAGTKKGQAEVGVGKEIWGTVATPPLTQEQVEGISRGTIRIYFVSWRAWTDLQGNKDFGYDCRWLQAFTLPTNFSADDLAWHSCRE